MRLFVMVALSTALLGACAGDVSEGKVEAEVKEVAPAAEEQPADTAGEKTAEAAEEAPTAPSGEAWAVDSSASKIHALGAKVTSAHVIAFPTFTGSVNVDGENVTAVAFEVDMNAMLADPEKEGGNKRLTGHLKSDDFFDVPNNPTSSFSSTAVDAGSDVEGMTHTITGNLTMAGKTLEVSFPAAVALGEGTVEAKTEFAIDRQKWGVKYTGKPDNLIQDKVVLTIELKAAKG